jgi:universal stress protein A
MGDYKHIIVAVDLSEDSMRLCQKALDVADAIQGRLLLVHVVEYIYQVNTLYDPLYYPGVENLVIDENELLEIAQDRMNKLLIGLADKLTDRQGVEHCTTEVLVGIPKTEILRLADEYQSDLIVCGSHGRKGLELLLGSTANAILHHAKCDVLAVRSKL